MSKPVIRTIHHMSATGGTLMSKCLAALPETYLLSEINPFAGTPVRFNPMDPLQQAVAQYQGSLGFTAQDLGESFLRRVMTVDRKVGEVGGHLVLRDHSHSDWLVPNPRMMCAMNEVLRNYYEVRPIVTLRNPVETYTSMTKYGWERGVGNFDEYCRRLGLFLDYFGGAPVFHYEDFVAAPESVLQEMAKALELPYDAGWQKRYRDITLTGDSGRGRQEEAIAPLPMREVSRAFRDEVLASPHYRTLCERLGYERDPEAMRQARLAALASGA